MLQTAPRHKKSTASKAAPHERFLEAFRWMLLARTLEEKLVSLYRGGLITGGVYVGRGQEAVSVACGLFLQKGDIFAPLIRDQAGRSAFGEPLIDVTRTYRDRNHRAEVTNHGELIVQWSATMNVAVTSAHWPLPRTKISARDIDKRFAERRSPCLVANQRRKDVTLLQK